MGQQGPPARDAASAARARRVARGSLLLTTRTASRRAKATGSFRSAPRVLDPDRKNKNNIFSTRRNAATWPTSDRNDGRLQIGTGGRLQVGMHRRLRRNPHTGGDTGIHAYIFDADRFVPAAPIRLFSISATEPRMRPRPPQQEPVEPDRPDRPPCFRRLHVAGSLPIDAGIVAEIAPSTQRRSVH